MILDIRNEQKEEITGIKFDDSNDYISWHPGYSGGGISFHYGRGKADLCAFTDLDNFVKALYKAKELAGK